MGKKRKSQYNNSITLQAQPDNKSGRVCNPKKEKEIFKNTPPYGRSKKYSQNKRYKYCQNIARNANPAQVSCCM
ncbi:MAG: hypothetical protein COX07_02890 [Bacteroidetes bacterium CG23_combo_of_CG06-09_8_20_14_all_32_9]|nr:MAG: hypothetical protein COX07_02890 [Bacteroidetes bacterium CG23_combo_of_CG06-09_8_20_14_all_32_9]